jgi:hypothetical protein
MTTISEPSISLSGTLPYGKQGVTISSLAMSANATANLKVGDFLQVTQSPITIEITAEDGITKKQYSLSIRTASASTEAILSGAVFSFGAKDYRATVNGFQLSFAEQLPYNVVGKMTPKSLTLSANATADTKAYYDIDSLGTIVVTAQDGVTKNTYAFGTLKDPDGAILFSQMSNKQCDLFASINSGDVRLENNMWNSLNLAPGSFSQCVYVAPNNGSVLFGWQYAYPDN